MREAMIVCLLAITGNVLSAQGRVLKGQEPAWPPTAGKADFTLSVAPRFQAHTLPELIQKSSIIIDATVRQRLPARVLAHRLETDAVLSINAVIKGPPSLGIKGPVGDVVVSQPGGILGGYVEEPRQYSMMHVGEHYLLFGREETRTTLPSVDGLPRYSITGQWVGSVSVDGNGVVRFTRASSQELHQRYDGMRLGSMVSELTALVRQ